MIEFAVVGAGPVGLFVACLLAAAGREVVVLEQEAAGGAARSGEAAARSRAIGIHPPALEALATVGLADELVSRGRRIETVRLMLGAARLGTLSLRACPAPYRFVLTLPQHATEDVMRRHLHQLLAGAVWDGAKVVEVMRGTSATELICEDGRCLRAGFVIACDGRSSRVRDSLSVPVEGGALDHHYLMADVDDDGSLVDDAAISLGRDGVVESFPLPGERRRWVARTRERSVGATARDLAEIVEKRTGILVDAGDASDASASVFTAEQRIAGSLAGALAGENWALAGDAAHVISPIGGQGMNLGLLGGLALVRALTGSHQSLDMATEVDDHKVDAGVTGDLVRRLADYDSHQRARARAAARRAYLNMTLGSDRFPELARWLALRTVLLPGVRERSARFFTMRGL